MKVPIFKDIKVLINEAGDGSYCDIPIWLLFFNESNIHPEKRYPKCPYQQKRKRTRKLYAQFNQISNISTLLSEKSSIKEKEDIYVQ